MAALTRAAAVPALEGCDPVPLLTWSLHVRRAEGVLSRAPGVGQREEAPGVLSAPWEPCRSPALSMRVGAGSAGAQVPACLAWPDARCFPPGGSGDDSWGVLDAAVLSAQQACLCRLFCGLGWARGAEDRFASTWVGLLGPCSEGGPRGRPGKGLRCGGFSPLPGLLPVPSEPLPAWTFPCSLLLGLQVSQAHVAQGLGR